MPPLVESTARGGDRARLASVALGAALSVDGVLAADAGPRGLHATASGGTLVRGVRVVAEPGGRYGVELGLQAGVEPLQPLADRIRERVRRRAEATGLAARLGPVSVTFYAVLDADEAAALVLAEALEAASPEPVP